MAKLSEDDIKAEITNALRTIAPDRLAEHGAIACNQDLLHLVDSFGFIQVLMAIEEPLGVELDLAGVDLSDIVRLDDLIIFIQTTDVARPMSASSGVK